MDDERRTKIISNIIFAVIILLLCLAAYWVYISIQRSGSYTLDIETIPADSSITINGLPSSKITFLQPGDYTIKATSSGFADYEITTDIHENTVMSMTLVPESKEAQEWVDNNKDIISEDYNEAYTINPILVQLPYENLLYSISVKPGTEKSNPLVIDINAFPGYRNAPIEKIKEMGYDPTNYQFRFNSGGTF